MNKKMILKKTVAMCLAAFMAVTAFPTTSYAKGPTLDTSAQELTIGKNQLTFRDYDVMNDTLLGAFTVPETGNYTFQITNNGSISFFCNLLDEDMVAIEGLCTLSVNARSDVRKYSLKQGEKYYFYIDHNYYSYSVLLAAKITISKAQESNPVLDKTALSIKKGSKSTLKLKNNKKKIVWVSSDKTIATVSSKGVVTAKKKGTAYIWAIVNSKAYKCKVAVYE